MGTMRIVYEINTKETENKNWKKRERRSKNEKHTKNKRAT